MAHIITSRDRQKVRRRPQWPYCLNTDSPLVRDLFLWYPMGAGGAVGSTARVVDFGPRGQHLNPQGAPTWHGDPEMGLVVSPDYTVPDYWTGTDTTDYYAGLNGLTIAAWVKTDNSVPAGSIFVRYTGLPWDFYFGTGPRIRAYIYSNGVDGSPTLLFATSLIGNWMLAALTWDSLAGGKTWANTASSAASGSGTLYAWGARVPSLGAKSNGTYPLQNSHIADVRLWRRALSDGEIAALWSPETRWDMYYPLGRKSYLVLGAGTGGDITATAETPTAAASAVSASATHTKYATASTPTAVASAVAASATHTKYATAETPTAAAAAVSASATHTKYATAETPTAVAAAIAASAAIEIVRSSDQITELGPLARPFGARTFPAKAGDIAATLSTPTAAAAAVSASATHTKYATAETPSAAASAVSASASHTKYATAETPSAAASAVSLDGVLDTGRSSDQITALGLIAVPFAHRTFPARVGDITATAETPTAVAAAVSASASHTKYATAETPTAAAAAVMAGAILDTGGVTGPPTRLIHKRGKPISHFRQKKLIQV